MSILGTLQTANTTPSLLTIPTCFDTSLNATYLLSVKIVEVLRKRPGTPVTVSRKSIGQEDKTHMIAAIMQ